MIPNPLQRIADTSLSGYISIANVSNNVQRRTHEISFFEFFKPLFFDFAHPNIRLCNKM